MDPAPAGAPGVRRRNVGAAAAAGDAGRPPTHNGPSALRLDAQPGMDDTIMHSTPSIVDLYQLASDNVMLKKMIGHSVYPKLAPASGSPAGEEDSPLSSPPASSSPTSPSDVPALFATALPLIRQGYMSVVDDSFTRCFKSSKSVPWNWNAYLAPVWALGVLLRYSLLFPLRLLALLCGFILVGAAFPAVKCLGAVMDVKRMEIALIQFVASAFVVSWSGVIRFHGLRPTPRAGQPAGIFVANHSSMIDFIILLQSHPYAVVGQKHPGWVGFLQDHLLRGLHCIWFDRGEEKDRRIVAERLKSHASDPRKASCPMLVFPEGTCVNNEFVVQFKKGVFELGVPINPIAIKYNKVFVDGYWNSRQQSFAQHLVRLMTSWAVVADIWFLDPQTKRPGEDAAEFARRIQRMIAARAGLKAVDWDGYMKYWKPSERLVENGKRAVGEQLISMLHIGDAPDGRKDGNGLSNGAGASVSAAPVAATAAPLLHQSAAVTPPAAAAAVAVAGAASSTAAVRIASTEGGRETVAVVRSPASIVLSAATLPISLSLNASSPLLGARLGSAPAPVSTASSNSTFEIGDDTTDALPPPAAAAADETQTNPAAAAATNGSSSLSPGTRTERRMKK